MSNFAETLLSPEKISAPLLITIILLVLVLIIILCTGVLYAILRICNRLYVAFSGSAEQTKDSFARKATRKKHFWIALIVGILLCAYYFYQLTVFNGPPWIN